ncbi:hypothetical protein GE191_23430 [Serratia fonticola]|uniref:hypothetical protein n=1 Tax=Serratia fonticola TaxID=47917 RepID=UPI0013779A83|nr:hypothetical protein [Serratia fonticola]NBJ36609.1 hypothetical protein [Serratia fonticola]
MAKARPYSPATRNVIDQIALVMVVREIEREVVAPMYEKETGKPYSEAGEKGYLAIYLKENPEHTRAYKALHRAIQKQRKAVASSFGRERNNYGR